MTNHVHLVAVPEHEESLARALGGAHSEYALAINRADGRTGHLWQNRFFSCPLDERHLLSALRYVDLNAVRAGLAHHAWDWPWSSACAHATLDWRDDALDCRWTAFLGPWDYPEWKEILSAAMPVDECDAVRGATRKGEPLGADEFVNALERRTGRTLRVLARGRPKREANLSAAGPPRLPPPPE
jgi:putative transposase